CNAIYFKGQWLAQFDPKATHSAPFFLGSSQQVQVPLMTKTFRVRSRQFDDFTAFTLPYTSNALSMVILLPKAVDGLPSLEQKLDSTNLNQWMASVQSAPEVKSEVFLPKFKMNCRLDLTPTLSAMGMGTAFSAGADFSGMTRMPGLCISEVVHQAYVDVNEEGTEAAAATGTIMRLTATVEHITVLRVDHPFIFLIRENRTGSILFLGRVMDPSKE
ncbi:MAG: serpin family protein, partial [Limisphaerales bacterium]